jgi:hypothetical protein
MSLIDRFPFHIFAYDALRRIYKAENDIENENKIKRTMKDLVSTDIRSKSLMEYSYLLDRDIVSYLST